MTSSASPLSLAQQTHSADRYFKVANARLRYRDEGQGPAVILVHGWTLDLEMWEPQVTALRDAFRLVRLDRRGYGLSGGTPAGDEDAGDIAALCAHLNLQRVALVGMSQGARSVLRLASSEPARVAALILDGPPALDGSALEDDVPLAHLQVLVQTQGMEAFRREWGTHALMRLLTRDPQMERLVRRMIDRYPGHEFTHREPLPTGGAPIALDAMLTPTLVLSGAHDLPSRVQAARRLSTRLRHADYRQIADAGHLSNLDQPTQYSELCRLFLNHHLSISAH